MGKDFFCPKKDKWFIESSVPYDTSEIKIGTKVKKRLYSGKSPFQKVEVFDTYGFGRILVLDGILQTSEKDEFVYHEMICHTPIFLHKDPKRVLIIGGGDGGSLEEVLKHRIEEVRMVEIDKKVIEVSRKYIPSISKEAFKDKRAELIIGDGKAYIKKHKDFFDIIILDLSDPTGPGKDLISLEFYKNVRRALKKDGIVSIQSQSLSTQPKLVSIIFKRVKKVFPYCEIHKAVVFSYQTGEFTFTIGAKKDLSRITEEDIEKRFKRAKLNLKYYNPEIHFASKVLPRYLEEIIKK